MFDGLKFFASWLSPTWHSLSNFSIPWSYRWRLLILQPFNLFSYSAHYFRRRVSGRYSVIQIPTRGQHTTRALVYQPLLHSNADDGPRPLHIDFHGGAFLGGLAEYDTELCESISDGTGTVVVSAQYRCFPHFFPAAHEDAEDTIDWILKNAKSEWNADPERLTVSGSSVGANLMFLVGARAKAAIGIYPVVDFRIPPWEKPKPASFPKEDPSAVLMPLFDAYAGPVRLSAVSDARLHPILRPVTDMPSKVLFVIAGQDILVHEELSFIEQAKRHCPEGTFDTMIFDHGFHGWLEIPSWLIKNKIDKQKVFSAATEIVRSTHLKKAEDKATTIDLENAEGVLPR